TSSSQPPSAPAIAVAQLSQATGPSSASPSSRPSHPARTDSPLPFQYRRCAVASTSADQEATNGGEVSTLGPRSKTAAPSCSQCSTPLRKGWEFCARCGSPVAQAAEVGAKAMDPVIADQVTDASREPS